MGRTSLMAVVVVTCLFVLLTDKIYAQTTDDTSQGLGETPQVVNPQTAPDAPIIDNSGMVYPRENLDPFGYSSLGGTTESGYRQDTSTLDRDTRRKSNIEVNKPREKKSAEEEAQSEEEAENAFSQTEEASEPEGIGYTTPGRDSGLYRWKDENGVLHVTNDLGSVPAEYQEEMIKGSE